MLLGRTARFCAACSSVGSRWMWCPRRAGSTKSRASSWKSDCYRGIDGLTLNDDASLPHICRPDQVLIRVKASSVNPIDVLMTEGYGRGLFEACPRQSGSSPITLGRDFAGVVTRIGGNVTNIRIGDSVMGVIPPPLTGSHSDYVLTTSCNVVLKSKGLSMEEAASLPYAALTAWSALRITGGLSANGRRQNILVLGASGGVGSLAIQLLKIWKHNVVATCSSDAVNSVMDLGCDTVIDYTLPDADSYLEQAGKFDVILDCTGCDKMKLSLLKPWWNAKYVTLSPPTLRNFDQFGLMEGLVRNGLDLFRSNSAALAEGKTVRWAFFTPNPSALKHLASYTEKKQLRPVIDSIHPFENLPQAYEKVKSGHLRGKVVVSHSM